MIDLAGSVVSLGEAMYRSTFLNLQFLLDPLVKIVRDLRNFSVNCR